MNLSPNTLYPGYTVETDRPQNLRPEDLPLFARNLSLDIPPVTLQRVAHAQVLKDAVLALKPFHFYIAETRVVPVKPSQLLKRLPRLLLPAHTLDQGLWITHEWGQAYYHWFADVLCRLEAVRGIVDTAVPVLLPQHYARYPYIVESLQMLGCTPFYYKPGGRVVVNDLFLPSFAAPMGLFYREIVCRLRERLAHKPTQPPHRKVFISRAKARVRRILNETAVQELLATYGYETHYMEDYSLAQQITLMAETRALVGLHGAGLTNMLFMQPGARVLELRNAGDDHSNCFFNMASDLGHRYYYTTNAGDSTETYDVSITVNLEELEKVLSSM